MPREIALNEATKHEVRRLISRAYDLLYLSENWIKGDMARDAKDRVLAEYWDEQFRRTYKPCKFCMTGAVMHEVIGSDFSKFNPLRGVTAHNLDLYLFSIKQLDNTITYDMGYPKVSNLQESIDTVQHFNDYRLTKHSDVLDCFGITLKNLQPA